MWVKKPSWDVQVNDLVAFLPHPEGVARQLWMGFVEKVDVDSLEGKPMLTVNGEKRFFDGIYMHPGTFFVWRR